MAWTTPITATINGTLTAAQWNASVRDNLMEVAGAKVTGNGNWWCSTGANALTLRSVGNLTSYHYKSSTTSLTYTTLSGGPSITLTTGSKAIVILRALIANDTVNSNTRMSYSVSGATSIVAQDVTVISVDGIDDGYHVRYGVCNALNGLTPGTNTFTASYRVGSGTGSFSERHIQVWLF